MSARLALSFDTDGGNTFQLSVAKANTAVDAAAVNAAMDAVMAADIFSASAGNLTAKKGARLIITETAEITE